MRARHVEVASLVLLSMLAAGCSTGNTTPPPKTPVPACVPSSSPEFAYSLNEQTVSMFTVDSCTGTLSPTVPATVATGGNNFGAEEMVVDPGGRFAYVANLMSNATDQATIAMFTINPSTGILTPTTPPTVPTGFFPQGIGIDPSGTFVYTANSDDNTISMFTVNQTTGVLTPTTPPTVATGWSPLSITVDPSGRFAYAANQDDGTVSMYTVNSTTGVLTPTTPAAVPAGGSPFGVTIDPSTRFAYVPDAYGNNMVSEYTIDSTTGVLTPTAQIGAFAGNNPTSVAVDPSSKFAYVTNRQDNSVSMFIIDQDTGDLTSNGIVATGVEPFRIVFDPSGNFAYVADEETGVSIYSLHSDGTLMGTGTADAGGGALSVAVTGSKQ
jgi:YVTN family beta-propeller protein